MNNALSIHITRFFVLALIQVVIFNNINFYGYLNPYIYILFIIFFPIKNNRGIFLLTSFLLGIVLDMFLDSGGIHAASCVFIAYVRPLILKFSFGTIYEHQTIRFNSVDLGSKFTYIILLVILHHILLFSLEIFSFSKIILTLQKTLLTSIFTILLCVILTIIFSRKTK